MSSFSLKKGGAFQLKKSISSVLVGCGWKPAKKEKEVFDLDAHAFALIHPNGVADKATFYTLDGNSYPLALTWANKDMKVMAPDINPKAFKMPDGSMVHRGDNRNGEGEGDDELIEIALDRLPQEVMEVAIWVTIHEAMERKQTFDRVSNAFVRVMNNDTGEELCNYPLNEKFPGACSVHVGSLSRNKNSIWEFVAVGSAAAVELGTILEKYTS